METQNVFNGPALMLGSAAMLVCLLIQGAAVVTVMTVLKPRIQALARQKRAVMSHLLFSAGILALLGSHLLQIFIWAKFLDAESLTSDVHRAIVFAGSTYTTVGFTADTLPQQWQLLAVIMAVTGLFAFAWSTSALYALLQRLYHTSD